MRTQQSTVRSVVPSRLGAPGAPRSDAALTPTSFRIQGDVPFHDWVQHGRRLGVIGRGAGWWLGDWLNYGNAKYGERYARASRITGYDAQTLMNMVYVASRFEASRRRENLSWSHHAEVAALPYEEQERWLTRADVDRLSVRCLREEIRRERRVIDVHQPEQLPASTVPDEPAYAGQVHVHCPACGNSFALTEADQDDGVIELRNGDAREKRAGAALPALVAVTD